MDEAELAVLTDTERDGGPDRSWVDDELDDMWLAGFEAGYHAALDSVLNVLQGMKLSSDDLRGLPAPDADTAPGPQPVLPLADGKALETYPSLGEFYLGDVRRCPSDEHGFGVHWRLRGWPGLWHVSYIRATGEVYALHDRGTVIVLGMAPADTSSEYIDRSTYWYATLDGILEGWPMHCGVANGLSWVIEKLRPWR